MDPLPSSSSDRSWIRDLLILAIVFGGIYFFVLGRAPLDNPDEGRYAEIPREMLATGDWITPRLDGVNYFEKPPLVYWCVALSIRAFGPGELAVRLTPALFGLAGVLLTYACARRMFGRSAGVGAAAVLGSSVLYAGVARFLALDMPVSVLMAAVLMCFILGIREPPGARRRQLFMGLYAAAALATLTKGLIGFLLTGAVMFLWLLIYNQWKRLRPLHLPTGVLLFLLIAAPWHVLAARHNPTWAHFYFIHEHWERFTTKSHGRYQPPYYFVPILIGGLFPWIGFLWPAVRRTVVGGWRRRAAVADRGFFLVWAAVIFGFFSLSDSKLPAYILPIFPALAVLIGEWLAEAWRGNEARALRFGSAVFSILAVILGLAAAAVVLRPDRLRLDPDQAEALRRPALALAAVLFAGAIAAWRARRRGQVRASLVATGLTAILMIGIAALVTPWLYRPSTRPLAWAERAADGGGARVFHYHEFFHDFTYYAGRTVELVDFTGELEPQNDPAAVRSGRFVTTAEFLRQWNQPAPAFVVARQRDLGQLLANKDFRYHLIARTPDTYLLGNRLP